MKYTIRRHRVAPQRCYGLHRLDGFLASFNDLYRSFGYPVNGIHSLGWWLEWEDGKYQTISGGFSEGFIMNNNNKIWSWTIHSAEDCPVQRIVDIVHGSKTAEELLQVRSQYCLQIDKI